MVFGTTAWRCSCCGWHYASRSTFAADALRTYLHRVKQYSLLRERPRDLCIWCACRRLS